MRLSKCLQRPIPIHWVAGLAVCACFSGMNTAVGQSERNEDFEVIVKGVDFSAMATGCSYTELTFSGELYFRSRGQPRRPLLRATYTTDNGWDEPKTERLRPSPDGVFQVAVPVWDHSYSSRKEGEYEYSAGRARVTVSAKGCKSQTFKVTGKWKPKVIVLKCPDRRR